MPSSDEEGGEAGRREKAESLHALSIEYVANITDGRCRHYRFGNRHIKTHKLIVDIAAPSLPVQEVRASKWVSWLVGS